MEVELIRGAQVLHAQLLVEARAARPGTGARRATEKAEYCRALGVMAARVREWLRGGESTISAFARMMGQTEADLTAAIAAALVAPDGKRRGWCCGLHRALCMTVEVFEEAAVRMEEADRVLGRGGE